MEKQIEQTSFLKILQYIFFGGILLYLGKSFFIPFCFALFISFMLYPICKWFERKKIPLVAAILLSLSLLLLLLGFIAMIFIKQMSALYEQFPLLQIKVSQYVKWGNTFLSEIMNISEAQQNIWFKNFISEGINDTLSFIWSSSGSFAVFVIIPVYAGLILFYRNKLVNFLIFVIPPTAGIQIKSVISEAIISYYNFIKGMLLVYLIVGILNGIGLYFLSVPAPFLFGFIASILTIIPYIGIIAGALLPITSHGLHTIRYGILLGVIIVFSIVQVLEANIIFPIAVGHRLKINPLSIIVVVMLGATIWESGMILFIPFLAILKLISEKVPAWQSVSLLLNEK